MKNTPKFLKIIGILPLAFYALISLVFGIGESAGGDLSGLMHLVPVLLIVVLIWVAWKFPYWAGILLLAYGVIRILLLIPEFFMRPAGSVLNPSVISLTLIPLIAGGLFLYAGKLERKPTAA
jgi:hypothetical protein